MKLRALAPVRVTGPATRLVTRDEARAHLKDDLIADAEVDSLILAAESYLDGYSGVLGRALITQTWEQSFDDFPGPDHLRLPLGPIQSVTSVKYYDLSDVEQTFPADRYVTVEDTVSPKIVLKSTFSWVGTYDREDAVTVRWVAGYGDAATNVPAAIIHAAKLLIGHFNENREAVGAPMAELPLAVRALVRPFKRGL